MLFKFAAVALAVSVSAHHHLAQVDAVVGVNLLGLIQAGVAADATVLKRQNLVDADVLAEVSVLDLINANVGVDAHVVKRSLAKQSRSVANVNAAVSVNLDAAIKLVETLLSEIEDVVDKVGTVADDVLKAELEPLLTQLITIVAALEKDLGSIASQVLKRSLSARDNAALEQQVYQLFNGVASTLNTVEGIVATVPVLGPVLDSVLTQLNPLLSKVLTVLDRLVAGLLIVVSGLIHGLLDGSLPGVAGLLDGVLGSVAGLVTGLLGGL